MGTATRISNSETLLETRELQNSDLSTSGFRLQDLSRELHVFPYFPFRGRVAKQVRRVECGNQLGAAVIEHAAPQARNRIQRPEQRPGRKGTERDDDLRLDDVDLTE